MTAADIPTGMRLKDITGWNQTPADWERFLRSDPNGCFVAAVDSAVKGTVATISYEDRFAWIAMVLVDPEHRGRGIATRLLQTAIEYLEARGITTMKLDATPQGEPIYAKLGFVPEYSIERCVLRRAAHTAIEPADCTRDLTRIVELDRDIFGADRSQLLDSLDANAPLFTMLCEDGADFSYALGRRGSRADHIGPWIATEARSATRVLDEFLRRSTRASVLVDVLVANTMAMDLVRSRGFELSRPLTRMYRGQNRFPGRPELICAATGPEFG